MNWQPLGDIVFVRPLMAPEATSAGIVIPDANRQRPSRGLVLAVGPGQPGELTQQRPPIDVKPDELVLFGQFAGMAEEIDGEPVLLLRHQECLGKVPAGQFSLIEHADDSGRKEWHLDTESCVRCPSVLKPEPSTS